MVRPGAPARRYSILGYQLPSADDVLDLLPTPQLVLRSAVLGILLLASLFISLVAWFVFYRAVGVKPGVTEVVWFQYGHFRPPYADLVLSPLVVTDQEYDVRLELTVPSSTRNVELGNFMVNLALVNSAGTTTLNVSRPSTLHYRSPLSQTLSTLSPLSLLSLRSADVQRIIVPLVESTILRTRRAGLILAQLEMGRKDAHGERWRQGELGEVQVYEARIKYEAKMRGLSYLIYRHPVLVFLFFIPSFLFFELLAAGVIWGYFVASATPSSIMTESGTETKSASGSDLTEELIKSEDDEDTSDTTRPTPRAPRMEGESDDDEDSSESDRLTEMGTDDGTGWDAVKAEDMNDDGMTSGSRTTRGTVSSFGPSVASTGRSSTSTAPSALF